MTGFDHESIQLLTEFLVSRFGFIVISKYYQVNDSLWTDYKLWLPSLLGTSSPRFNSTLVQAADTISKFLQLSLL